METARVAHPNGVPRILAEIREQGDLGANPQAIERLNRVLNREYCTTLGLAHAILQDPGLSAKILRVVNSVAYSVRGEPVSTITRAIVLIGFERVREIATGLLLIEHFTRGQPSDGAVHENLRRALRCGLTAQAIAARVGQVGPEQAYLLGLFSNVGLLWLAAYHPAVLAEALERQSDGTSLDDAVHAVAGITPNQLAAEVLRHWSLPDTYVHHFERRPEARAITTDRLSAVVEIADGHARVAEREPVPDGKLLARFERTFGLPGQKLVEAVAGVEEELRAQARILGIAVPRSGASRAAPAPSAQAPGAAARSPLAGGASAPDASADAPPVESVPAAVAAAPRSRDASLAIDVALEVSSSILVDDDVNHNLTAVVEGIARSGPFDVVVLALLTPERDRLNGRFGFGPRIEAQMPRVTAPVRRGAGLLAEAVLDGVPRIVEDGSAAMLVPAGAPIPHIAVSSFAIQPLVVRRLAIGVVFAGRTGGSRVSRGDLPVLQMLCNLACIGLREIGRKG